MALMIPEAISSNASQGEKALYKILLEELPNNFCVWHKQIVQGFYPDFIILAPNFGLLIIEVIAWYPNQIVSADSQDFTITFPRESREEIEVRQSYIETSGRRTRKRSLQTSETKKVCPSPLKQGKEFLDKLLSILQNYQILTQTNGESKSKLAFPVGFGIVMSNMTQNQGKQKNIYDIFSEHQVIYRDELLSLSDIGKTDLLNRLERIFTNRFPFQTLTSNQIDTIKAILYPEIAIQKVPASPYSISDGVQLQDKTYVFRTLDHRQECIARGIGEGHRIIYGVAGSGKTLILLCYAKLLANQNHIQKILILCFNRSLAAYLKFVLYEDIPHQDFSRKIEVFTFYSWVSSEIKKMPAASGFIQEQYDEILGEILLEKLRNLPIEKRYDAVLVDEAQTFHTTWLKCCVAALKEPEDGNLMIVSDGNQSLYKRCDFTWKSVGVKAVGRTSSKKLNLDKNYRNTKEILAAAWSVVSHIQNQKQPNNIEKIEDELPFNIVKPTAALSQGLLPVLHIEQSENHEIEAVVREIKNIQKADYAGNEIAVLYRMAFGKKIVLIDSLIKQLHSLEIATYWVSKTRETEKRYSTKNPGIKIINALSSLGLEFKVVLILWVQDWEFNIPAILESDILTCRRLYVALTRAQDRLHVFGSGNSSLLKELQHNGNFEVKQG